MSIADAAKAIGLGTTKTRELVNSGQLKIIKIGRRTLVRVDSIHALVAGEKA
jgi:excisionase family DNA binding protein